MADPIKVNLAYTAPVNPPNASPKLTHAQIWEAMVRKVDNGADFVGAIESCSVVERRTEGKIPVVVRKVVFKPGFEMPDGSMIENIISKGPDGELYLTYSFQWVRKDLKEGTKEFEDAVKKYDNATGAVTHSIDVAREMVKDGRIKA